jgi:hypothetical protein
MVGDNSHTAPKMSQDRLARAGEWVCEFSHNSHRATNTAGVISLAAVLGGSIPLMPIKLVANLLKCGVEPFELDTGGSGCEAPVCVGVVRVAPVQPSFHFLLQSLPVGDAPVEALGDEDSQL